MSNAPTIENVLSDIEFELIQGTLSHNELGRGIQAVKKHHEKIRHEVFENSANGLDLREIASQQFQINEMLLRLLQETATNLRELQWQHKQTETAQPLTAPITIAPPNQSSEQSNWWPPLEIEEAMQANALQQSLDSRPVAVPLIGGLLQYIRDMLHHLVLFYINKMAAKQGHINQTYGEWIIYLAQLQQQQAEKIQQLEAQLAAKDK